MVATMGRIERRGRKRRRIDVRSVETDQDGQKRVVSTRSKVLVGRYVRKEFEGSGMFLGKVMSYDSGLYRVNYEDGDCEDLDSSELKGVLIEHDALDGNWLERKERLDELIYSKGVTAIDCHVQNAILPMNVADNNVTSINCHVESAILQGNVTDTNVTAIDCHVESAILQGNVTDTNVTAIDCQVEDAILPVNVADNNVAAIDCQVENATLPMDVPDNDVTSIDCQVENAVLPMNVTDNNVTAVDSQVENAILPMNVPDNNVKAIDCQVENAILPMNVTDNDVRTPMSFLGSHGPCVEAGQVDDGAESTSDLSEDDDELDLISDLETPVIPPPPPPELPLSSGNIVVPEEYVSYVLSVYSFLRSFSIRLFLSPFGLDDFVGSLNCPTPNTLFDSVHVALMRALRQRLEKLSLDGFELASKCLRNLDWSLLDSMTWPIYLVQYLLAMKYLDGPVWKGFGAHVLEREYYSISTGQKLTILQILCDDVLDAEEVRAEMDMREASELGTDSEGAAVAPFSGPRRVHPRYSKTSAFKEQETMEIIAKDDITSSHSAGSLSVKVSSAAGIDADQDGNGDECRLCGMEGTLLCCDGCPSAYHPRCIGVCKMYIPDGNWFCPECRINKLRPTPIRGTSLKGAELFGVDCYGLIFMGSCDHLLVLKDSMNSGSCLRYYSESDIPRVLQALNTNVQHYALYSEICKGIREYWGIPDNVLAHSRVTGIVAGLTNRTEDGGCSVPSLATLLGKESHVSENFASCAAEISSENTQFDKYSKELMLNEGSKQIIQTEYGSFNVGQDSEHMNSTPFEQFLGQSTIFAGSVSQQADLSRQTQEDHSGLIENASCTSRDSINCIGYNSEYCVGTVASECGSFQERCEKNHKNSTEGGLYTGSSFKVHGYLNYYTHGDFVASAAASLAVLSSEENQCSESQSLEKRRRLMSVDVQLQTKAFSSVATRFFWPNTEKKLIEVPRERCSWCLSCKAPVASKKACLLNAAALNATKGAMKILATIRPAKSGDGNLPGIATYVIFMEESLRGLTVGPFLSEAYRKLWRKQAEDTTSCYTIKSLLLELEENIRLVALSADWVKLVDGCSSEPSVTQTAASVPGSSHKRKPGRRGRKPSAVAVVSVDDGKVMSKDFTWWRGGMLSKFMFQRGTLPQSVVKKAARKGGKRKIPGIYYSEGCEAPKRNRRLVWRATVEMCKTASQLALQVRYLDMHVRWSDLVRPEPSLQEGKGGDSETSAFRNACICDKGIVDNEIRYGVAFANQKHLSSRVMKSVVDMEKKQDGKEKYWFSESRVPLYLIKEYEAKLVKNLSSAAVDEHMNAFSKRSRKLSKTFRRDIFTYLALKRDGNDKRSCAFCQVDVLLRNGIICGVCQGLCHEQCTISATVNTNDDFQRLTTCKRCYQNSSATQCGISNESPTSPLLLQGQESQNADTARKGGPRGSSKRSSSSARGNRRSSEVKPDGFTSSKSKVKTWGLIWKKPNTADTGDDFRNNNILRKGNLVNGSGPECQLCHKPYNPDLMFIHCETCQYWYHADAVELEESKVSNVVGFKCCRCRRIRIPICPYLDPESKRLLMEKRNRSRSSRSSKVVDDLEIDSDSGVISETFREEESCTPLVPLKEDDDFLSPLSSMDKITKKLPIRRQIKCENNSDSLPTLEASAGKVITPCADKGTKPGVECNTSTNGCQDSVAVLNCDGLSYEDMEFEPQTYFSFNELLESDECVPFDGNVTVKLEDSHTEDARLISTESLALEVVPCMMCSHTDPNPNLHCQTCGIRIHDHCSPWVEEPAMESVWRCGNCREWR